MDIENVKQTIKKAIPKEWKEINEKVITDRQESAQRRFEKLPRLDLRGKPKGVLPEGTDEQPVWLVVKALSNRRTVKTDRMTRPMNVFDAEVVFSNVTEVVEGKYSIWENTTVLEREMESFAQTHGANGNIENHSFIVAYYGRQKNKKEQNVYIYRVLPYGEDTA